MEDEKPSATALVVALIRAAHTRTAPQPVINDPWGDQLVSSEAISAMREYLAPSNESDSGNSSSSMVQADIDAMLCASPAHANVVLRSRYTEEALQAAVAAGVTQYVLIGAGFDSFCLRVPSWAQQLTVFEIDHPATQGMKTRRLSEIGHPVHDSVHFLAADLSRESLAAVLANSPYNPQEPTFFSLLGVTMYLSAQDNRATMRDIANCGVAGSELVFTYMDQALLAPDVESTDDYAQLSERVASVGEPFISGFDPLTLEGNLLRAGLALEEDLSDLQLIERYDPSGVNALTSVPESRIARAAVLGRNQ